MINDRYAVDQYVLHALRQAVGGLVGRRVADGCRIEDHEVGPHPPLEHAAIREAHALSGQRGEFAHRVLECELVLLPHVLAQDPRKSAVGTRMRVLLAQDSLGRGTAGIVVHRHPRLLERECDVGFRHPEHRHLGERIILNEQIEERIDRILLPLARHLRQSLTLQRQEPGLVDHADHDRLRTRDLIPFIVPLR